MIVTDYFRGKACEGKTDKCHVKLNKNLSNSLIYLNKADMNFQKYITCPDTVMIEGKHTGTALMFLVIFAFFSMAPQHDKVNDPAEKIYRAYVDQKMELWEQAIAMLDTQYKESGNKGILYELILARYGYIGYNLGIENKEKAREHISHAEKHIDKLIESQEHESSAYALQAALYAYRISMSPLMAVFWGRKTMNLIDKAIETDPHNPSAWIEHGNAMFYAPAALGGSKEEAIKSYNRAADLLEKKMSDSHRWLYLNTLVGLAKSYEETENNSMARLTYRRALDFEPEFKWVKDKLLPELIRKNPGML